MLIDTLKNKTEKNIIDSIVIFWEGQFLNKYNSLHMILHESIHLFC